jgi:hypothetical protein
MSGIERESGVISIPFLLKGVFILTMVNDGSSKISEGTDSIG